MNKIFKTKNDVTTGQTKVISELANNSQVASSSGEKPKCGQIAGRFALSFFRAFCNGECGTGGMALFGKWLCG
ncbi:hypothetical protein CFY87_05225 [Actinobacillus seminis]|uniref:Uncharacterized protein n=1 Tax=Actinobacillus seminis TaxID=722 RepID=A0A263HCD1_9PAST|nr:ESPR-type extended signal peptide-containing protein [Actinobacillus seminis]OZN25114.1 hypothetical protein CFY87_05225 [Actinobacillus seminis]SUU33817.1 Uncharacterised protein [Actinobacillus seminis]